MIIAKKLFTRGGLGRGWSARSWVVVIRPELPRSSKRRD